MGFFKNKNIYSVTRMTGNRNNILGVSFADEVNSENTIEGIEWDFPNIKENFIQTSKKEVLQQVVSGFKSINELLQTDYKLAKIYYVPSEDGSDLMYQTLIRRLIRHFHNGNEFKDVSNTKDE